MMYTVLISVASFIAIGLLTFITRQITKLYRSVNYIDKKHDALVHALHKWSGNGFQKDYDLYLNDAVRQDNFINK